MSSIFLFSCSYNFLPYFLLSVVSSNSFFCYPVLLFVLGLSNVSGFVLTVLLSRLSEFMMIQIFLSIYLSNYSFSVTWPFNVPITFGDSFVKKNSSPSSLNWDYPTFLILSVLRFWLDSLIRPYLSSFYITVSVTCGRILLIKIPLSSYYINTRLPSSVINSLTSVFVLHSFVPPYSLPWPFWKSKLFLFLVNKRLRPLI